MRWWLGWVAALAVAIGIGWGSTDSPQADGFILFQPPTGASPLVPIGEPGIRIDACEADPAGLKVRGRVEPGRPPIQVLATPEAPPGSGLRVGVTLAAQVPQFPGAVPGDFEVVIPWATTGSRFLVVETPADQAEGSESIAAVAERIGVGCPRPAGF